MTVTASIDPATSPDLTDTCRRGLAEPDAVRCLPCLDTHGRRDGGGRLTTLYSRLINSRPCRLPLSCL
jgi:hypothetical protein